MTLIACLIFGGLLFLGAFIDKSWIGYFFAIFILISGLLSLFFMLPFDPIFVGIVLLVLHALFFKKRDSSYSHDESI